MSEDRITLHVYIHNLTRAQAMAIEDLLATWQQGGSLGCSRWTQFYADGDGNFRPTCVVNGRVARHQALVPPETFWTGGQAWRGEYRIDFDKIAWALRSEDEARGEKPRAPASAELETVVTCERCQMKVPTRLASFGIGVRGGHAAWCAACRPTEVNAEVNKAEVIEMRRLKMQPGGTGTPA